MTQKFLLFISILTFSIVNLCAQDGLPSNPQPGKCYAKCVEKDIFKDTVIRVVAKPAYKVLKVVPAIYKTKMDSILVRPEIKKFVCTDPVISKKTERVYVKDPYNKIYITNTTFKDGFERVLTAPALERWEMGGKAPECKSIDPNDCRLVWYKKYPAQYENVPVRLLNSPAKVRSKEIRFDYKEIVKEVVTVPSKCSERLVSRPKYEVFQRRILVKDETTKEVNVPATYKNVTIKKLVKKGGLTIWREVECDFITGRILPILYEVNDYRLTSAAKKIIDDNLLTTLINEPLINIELSSHTDSRGDASANQVLSQRRAQSVVDYLVERGIDKRRLQARGYGETKLKNRCKDGVTCSKKEHAVNRRTEFRIIE